MAVEGRPGSLGSMSDDRLGTAAVSLVVSELLWAPDVVPATLDRIHRDAIAYPEQFDRRAVVPPPPPPTPPNTRSVKRTIGRVGVFAVILIIIVGLVLFATTVSGADHANVDESVAATTPGVLIGAIDGTLVSYDVGEPGALPTVDDGGRILHVVPEAS